MIHIHIYTNIYIYMYHIYIYIYIWQFLVCSCTRFPPAPVSTQVFLWSGLCSTRSKASCSGLAQGDALELNPRRKGIRWLSAAPGAAGENFLNHGLKKIEGSEGAILDKNNPFWWYFWPVSKSRIRKKGVRRRMGWECVAVEFGGTRAKAKK